MEAGKVAERYDGAVEVIKTAILSSQYEASRSVNAIQLSLYYGIGRFVSENSREGCWGQGAIAYISEKLRRDLPGLRGFGVSNIKNMRLFYEEWRGVVEDKSPVAIGDLQLTDGEEIDKSPVAIGDFGRRLAIPQFDAMHNSGFLDVPFTHHIYILSQTDDVKERLFYVNWCAATHATVSALKSAIAEGLAEKTDDIPSNFDRTIKDVRMARKAVEMFKDEYLLDFINVEEIGERDREDVDERVVEQEIVHNVKRFIMTFGKDFAFIGNQLHLEVFGTDHFPDLIFSNRELNCLVVVELKRGAFKPSYLGQLCAYIRMVDDQMRKPHENHTIGIVLCKEANRQVVEYVIQDYNQPMGVATYRTAADMPERLRNALPDPEELRKLLK